MFSREQNGSIMTFRPIMEQFKDFNKIIPLIRSNLMKRMRSGIYNLPPPEWVRCKKGFMKKTWWILICLVYATWGLTVDNTDFLGWFPFYVLYFYTSIFSFLLINYLLSYTHDYSDILMFFLLISQILKCVSIRGAIRHTYKNSGSNLSDCNWT